MDSLKADGFMCDGSCDSCTKARNARDEEINETMRERGKVDGDAAGSWVIDGSTSKERAREIFDGIQDCDPAIMDSLPRLCLGEWAGDPSFEDICHEEDLDDLSPEEIDDLFEVYADGWAEGMTERVQRDARLAMPIKIQLCDSDDDDGSVTVYCEDQEQAKHDQSVSIDGQSSRWECPRDMDIAYTSLLNCCDLEKALTDAGYEVDASEYSAPDDEDLAYWAYRNECENSGEDPLDREAWIIASLPQG